MFKWISYLTTFLVVVALGLFVFVRWTIDMVYVPVGQSLQITYKGPLFYGEKKSPKSGYWAEDNEIGVRKKLLGPGRHFYSPIWYDRVLVPDVIVPPGKVGIVKCQQGESLPAGEFLVDGDLESASKKGILRKVLTPGRYRINPYGFEVTFVGEQKKVDGNQVKHSGWVEIPTGYVGVVTNQAANPKTGATKGTQDKVLPPGLYPINGKEQQVDIVEIGYRETTVKMTKMRNRDGSLKLDIAGEPMVDPRTTKQGIDFPSSDGFEIYMDFTAIWGLMPNQAAHAVRTFGNVRQVEEKVVKPQIDSICRKNGSKYSAVEMLVGVDREKFQSINLEDLQKVLSEKEITLLYGLVRHIYIPQEVRGPIQKGFLAEELTITRQQEQETAKAEAELKEAEENISLERQKVTEDTERKFQQKVAEGDREARTIEAETEKMVAAIRKETAILNAKAVTTIGKATNEGKELIEKARADRFRVAVDAFGNNSAYNQWIFASELPDDIDLKFFYAGEGTMWTDMKNIGVRANIPVSKKSSPTNTRRKN